MSPSLLCPLPLIPTLSLNKTLLPLFSPLLKPPSSSSSSSSFSSLPILPSKSLICNCSNTPHSDGEEQRWLREEQRWLREEQRWLREEQRLLRERESLLRELSDLKAQIQALEPRLLAQDLSSSASASVSDVIANVAALLQVLKDKNSDLALESEPSQRTMMLEEKEAQEKEVVMVEEDAKVLGGERVDRVRKRSALRKGSEGEEVREMQEALLKLGFYSGEEDMEYSSFSSGTERAVKTWQASLGALEDGIMTAELLERLYLDIRIKETGNVDENKNSNAVLPQEGGNGAAVASVAEISKVQQTVVERGDTGVAVSHQRVFLLGENRWEDSSRLVASEGVDRTKNKDTTTKCLQCRGEGRLLCTECDGTGEANIEPQFLEWMDQGASCPYCEGLGYTLCDVCGGKSMV